MTKNQQVPFIENLLIWRGWPNLFVLIGLILGTITFLVGLSVKEMQIEQEHKTIITQTEDIQQQLNTYISTHK